MIQHLRRALKYFVQISFIFVVIMGVLMLSGMVSKDVSVAFRSGWRSIAYIGITFAAMSLLYPLFGYGKRHIRATGDPAGHRAAIDEVMRSRGYVPLPQEDGTLRYHLSSPVNRLARLWEDTITITPVLDGFEAEGLMRDLSRVVSSIDHKINQYV